MFDRTIKQQKEANINVNIGKTKMLKHMGNLFLNGNWLQMLMVLFVHFSYKMTEAKEIKKKPMSNVSFGLVAI